MRLEWVWPIELGVFGALLGVVLGQLVLGQMGHNSRHVAVTQHVHRRSNSVAVRELEALGLGISGGCLFGSGDCVCWLVGGVSSASGNLRDTRRLLELCLK